MKYIITIIICTVAILYAIDRSTAHIIDKVNESTYENIQDVRHDIGDLERGSYLR